MSTYREILAARLEPPRREYITNKEYAKLKAALTRAKNTGDGRKVLAAVENALRVFAQKVWPDDWARWRIALEDAAWKAQREGDHELADELYAASLVLFQ